jgi:protease I
MVIAYKNFRDEEYFKTRQVFENAGAEIKIASNKMGEAIGVDGNTVKIDILIKNVDVKDYDAIVFIGGLGVLTHLDNKDSYRIAEEAIVNNKVLAAICISPVILAKAGVLKGKKATVWTSSMDKSGIKILEQNGAEFNDEPVVIDGMIITGNGPSASKEFAMKAIGVLAQ